MPLLLAQELGCERGYRRLFSGLSFTLQCGQILQVAGANGSGKTTLLRMVCGLDDSHEGEIQRGEGFAGDIKESLCYIGHRPGVSLALTPLQNLRWSCGLHGMKGAGGGEG